MCKTNVPSRQINAQLIYWAFFLFILIFLSSQQITGNPFNALGTLALVTVFFYFSKQTIKIDQYTLHILCLVLLFFWSVSVSTYPTRSSLIYLSYATSFTFYLIAKDQFSQNRRPSSSNISAKDISIYVLMVFALIQSVALIYGYFSSGGRQTGFLLDFSQASFALLLVFVMSYSKVVKKPLAMYSLATILFTGIAVTFSRTTLFLCCLLFLFLLIYEISQKTKLISVRLLFLCLIIFGLIKLIPLTIGSETVSRGFSDIGTMNNRIYGWSTAIEAIKQNPFFGYGFGTFEFLGIKEIFTSQFIPTAHNDYLQIWVELGVVWFLAFAIATLAITIYYNPIFPYLFTDRTVCIDTYLNRALLLCCALYMLINFIVATLLFQLLIALILARVTTHEQK